MTIKIQEKSLHSTSAYVEIKWELLAGWMMNRNVALIKCNDYDYTWARKEGLPIHIDQVLVRIENKMTRMIGSHVEFAHIVKLNLKSGWITPLKDYDADADLEWDKAFNASVIYFEEKE